MYTSGTTLPRDWIKCSQAVQYCDGDDIKCPQVVQYCDEIVPSVHRQCNIATRLYQVYTSGTILREPLYYLRTSGEILRRDGIICPQVVQPWTNLPIFLPQIWKSAEIEGATSCGVAPLVLNIKKNGKSFGSLE